MRKLKVLIACEESQRVCEAFRKLGHEAYSCDIIEPSGGHLKWHIKGDVLKFINPVLVCTRYNNFYGIVFKTMDGEVHSISGRWDLIVAHPPCTYLSNAGACRLYPKAGRLDEIRYQKGLEGKEFFMKIFNALCEHIAIENPVPSKIFELPKYTQTIQPFEFGEPWSKKTCLWLKNLPKLKPTKIVSEYKPFVSCRTSRNKGNPEKAGYSRSGGAAAVRSRTFKGIAEAMAAQWSEYLTN